MTAGLAGAGLLVPRAKSRSARATSVLWLGLGAGVGAAAYSFTLGASLVISRSARGRRSLGHLQACTGSVPRPLAAALILPAALGEEWFWREGVTRALLGRGQSPGRTLFQGTACYSAVQAAALDPLPPAGALLLGLATGTLRLASGSIWPSAVAHVVYSELTLVAPGLARVHSLASARTGTEP
ncbi:MAG: CPBP family glutamic-type intramembrane protease [Candidatus Dormibacteria bacterium]